MDIIGEAAQKLLIKGKFSERIFADEPLRINEDEVMEAMRDVSERKEVLDEGEQRVSFFQMKEPNDEVPGSLLPYTSLRHFKVKHSNPHGLEELRKHQEDGDVDVEGKRGFKQMIKRDVVEYCFERDLEIFRITKKFKLCIKWMLGKGMLPPNRKCPCCDQLMRVVNCSSKVKDGLLYKCTRHDSGDVRMSIRQGTIFEGSSLTLMESLRLIFYYFARGFNAMQAFKELKEMQIPHIQYNYVLDMYRRARHIVHLYFQNHYRRHKLG